jgi:hypothetical protein
MMVLHRVVDTRWVLGKRHFMTKGDANATTDPDLRPAEMIFGRADYRIPHLGQYLHNFSVWPVKVALLSIAGVTIGQQTVVLLRIKRRGNSNLRGKRPLEPLAENSRKWPGSGR